ncbi:MAG: dihydropteroate synthase [Chloroflexi bacterium]|nr:MAG: dihydropteroate synthase [Chloroflexota bacterium]
MTTTPTRFNWGERTYIMGILNVTPDSFSGDGVGGQAEEKIIAQAVTQAKQFVADGADIIDIGGESTRPGSTPVNAAEELARVIPVIKAVRQAVDVTISIDSYRASVAEAALAAGANWLNDIWGARLDPDMAKLAAQTNCPIVLMHNRSKPKDAVQEKKLGGHFVGVKYDNLIADIKQELQTSIDIVLKAGVKTSQIILDPGIGFGKTITQNLQLLNQINQFKTMGFPILIGSSRKSFIGYTLDLPPDQRIEGTAATVAIGIERGADIVRVHDVAAMARVARMTDAIVRK